MKYTEGQDLIPMNSQVRLHKVASNELKQTLKVRGLVRSLSTWHQAKLTLLALCKSTVA